MNVETIILHNILVRIKEFRNAVKKLFGNNDIDEVSSQSV